jgi:hypothetical protein
MEIDFKITIWERVNVSDKNKEKVLQALQDGTISTANELVESGLGEYLGTIDETGEDLTVEENGGCSTVEALEEGNTIWSNGE